MSYWRWGWGAVGLALALGWPGVADACGGMFCDSGPQAMPVDQTGENILFVEQSDGTVSAQVQVQYTPGAERFAWVVPLPSVPVVSVGSQPLFDWLLSATVPNYGFVRGGCQAVLAVEGGGGVGSVAPEQGAAGPRVVFSETVGAFEVVVLEGGSADEVVSWLDDNDYEQVPDAAAFLAPYVDEGMVFAAVKLSAKATLSEVHPIVFRYAAARPGIPLRLTGIAAADDMLVRSFFLGADRYVPSNYLHMELNAARVNWLNFADNYLEVLGKAADEVGGHAFITEFAGPVPPAPAFYDSYWDVAPFVDAEPGAVVALLASYGLLKCDAATCTTAQPQVLPLLEKYLPPPADTDAQAFYSCQACYRDYTGALDFDGAAFARALLERVVVPAREAAESVAKSPYLTRLLTVLDAEEMTEDPAFQLQSGLPLVSAAQTASWDVSCDGAGGSAFALPWDLPEVALTATATWPEFDEEMPYAWRVEQFGAAGDGERLADNTEPIAEWLEAWNESRAAAALPQGSDAAEGSSEEPLVFDSQDPTLVAPSDGGQPAPGRGAPDGGSPDAGRAGPRAAAPPRRGGGCSVRVAGGGMDGSAYPLGLLSLLGAVRRWRLTPRRRG